MPIKKAKSQDCLGCYNDIYNHGAGGTKVCMMLADAKLIQRQRVHINDIPPYPVGIFPFKLMPNCYRYPQYAFINKK